MAEDNNIFVFIKFVAPLNPRSPWILTPPDGQPRTPLLIRETATIDELHSRIADLYSSTFGCPVNPKAMSAFKKGLRLETTVKGANGITQVTLQDKGVGDSDELFWTCPDINVLRLYKEHKRVADRKAAAEASNKVKGKTSKKKAKAKAK